MTTRWFDDIEVGTVTHYGRVDVTAEEIKDFASRWDPQPFHLDEEAAKATHFGGLVASGWHTAALWMSMTVREMIGEQNEAAMGSPGFLDLRWLKPVRPGDVLTCRSTVIEKVELKSRPDRGITRSRNEVLNQHGEVVMSFIGQGLMKKKPTDGDQNHG